MQKARVGKLITTLSVCNDLAEGVQWHIESQSFWWTDIHNSLIYQYQVVNTELRKYQMPERVGCFSFTTNDHEIIVAFASGMALYHTKFEKLTWLAKPEKQFKSHRFNDGRADRQGRFWAGTMVEQPTDEQTLGALYCLDQRQQCQKILNNINISNSLCWSPDSLTMYHANSPSRVIYRYDFNPKTGKVSNPYVFAEVEQGSEPDGACVDSEGYLWSAQWGGGKVVRYTPNGDIDLIHNLPVSRPTCVAIGGPNMDWLIITSAKQGLSEEQYAQEPLSGHLFIYQLYGVLGLPESKYQVVND